MNYSVAGPLFAVDAGDSAWRLSGGTAEVPSGVQILLRGASPSAVQLFADSPRIERVALEWRGDIVILTLTLAGGVAVLTARSAIVHEPQQNLYRCLPLAEFDPGARAFWQRVFGLMRIPGGRFLLPLLRRRGRR